MIQFICQLIIAGILVVDMLLLFRSDCRKTAEDDRFIGIVGTVAAVGTRGAVYYGAGAMSLLF